MRECLPGERPPRRRTAYLLLVVATIVAGLASRRYRASLPAAIGAYAGDTLWALMVFLGLGLVFPRASTRRLAGVALAIAYLDELSQLYHAPWIEAVRETRLGGLVLGFDFVWSDLLCYAAGVLAGAGGEAVARRLGRRAGERSGWR
jgi:hypothetical protein